MMPATSRRDRQAFLLQQSNISWITEATSMSGDVEQKPARRKATAKASKGINSVEIGIRVLNAVAASDRAMPLKDVSLAADLSPSQTHRYLASLIRQQLVVQDPQTGRYDLGRAAVRIGLVALNRLEPVRVAEEAVDGLVERIPETVMCTIWGEFGPVAVRWRRGSRLMFASIGLGTTFPLLTSATGRLFLAYLPVTATDPVLRAELKRERTAGRTPAASDIRQIAAEIRKQGHIEFEAYLAPGMWAAAAPVLDSQEQLVAALTIVGAADEPKDHRRASINALLAAARDASERLGAFTRNAGT